MKKYARPKLFFIALTSTICVSGSAYAATGTLCSKGLRRSYQALIITNSEYDDKYINLPSLRDGEKVGKALSSLGYRVHYLTDARRSDMVGAVDSFSKELVNTDIGFIYYSGQAFATPATDYIMPRDFNTSALAKNGASAVASAFSLFEILSMLDQNASCATKIILFDTERKYLLGDTIAYDTSIKREIPKNTFIGFATGLNATAYGGSEGKTSPFSEAISSEIYTGNLNLVSLFSEVTKKVRTFYDGTQVPESSSTLDKSKPLFP